MRPKNVRFCATILQSCDCSHTLKLSKKLVTVSVVKSKMRMRLILFHLCIPLWSCIFWMFRLFSGTPYAGLGSCHESMRWNCVQCGWFIHYISFFALYGCMDSFGISFVCGLRLHCTPFSKLQYFCMCEYAMDYIFMHAAILLECVYSALQNGDVRIRFGDQRCKFIYTLAKRHKQLDDTLFAELFKWFTVGSFFSLSFFSLCRSLYCFRFLYFFSLLFFSMHRLLSQFT